VVSDLDTLRHLLKQPHDRLNKRQARYVRDLQPIIGAMTFIYRNKSWNEVVPLSRRRIFTRKLFSHCFGVMMPHKE
jgi:hypothetical protein